ncbi:hypothetical protein EZ449_11890 [Pedobacter frigidisoli]|uniref:Uncharacterized protein n=1 Tax=Pedobacter frigidisoli TaxID=2530455 RepID=A0A4R0P427_9SPHI|nr:hypothetical protein [Pedobacter frigidisoli]TCD08538.1 hypothetical protein EZ449_11890 [Pedobacter frigidisoli]
MKLRITPLNIIGAVGLGLAAFNILSPKDNAPRHIDMSGFYLLILGCLILVTFITDLIFRFTLKDLKRIWVVESIFIVFTAILIVIIQKLT